MTSTRSPSWRTESELSPPVTPNSIRAVGHTGGVSELAGNYAALDGGIGEFRRGTGTLTSGTQQLADGLPQLNDNTKDLPAQIDETIDELLSGYDTSDFEPVSFVSAKNEGVHAVQFVFTTEGGQRKRSSNPRRAGGGELLTRLKNLFPGKTARNRPSAAETDSRGGGFASRKRGKAAATHHAARGSRMQSPRGWRG